MRQAQRDIVAMRRGFLRCAGLIFHLEELERNGIIDDIMKNECCGQTPRTWRVCSRAAFPCVLPVWVVRQLRVLRQLRKPFTCTRPDLGLLGWSKLAVGAVMPNLLLCRSSTAEVDLPTLFHVPHGSRLSFSLSARRAAAAAGAAVCSLPLLYVRYHPNAPYITEDEEEEEQEEEGE